MSDPLVTTAWLAKHLGDPDVQVIDATWYMPNEDGSGRADYAAGHVPGAVFFDIDQIADHAVDLPHMLPSPEAFAAAAGALGLRREATIVVYDARGIFSAPRVWWTLRAMGFSKVFVLDGGLKVWRAEGRPLETTTPSPGATRLAPAFDPALVRDLAAVEGHLARHSAQLVDARSAGRFRGETPEPRADLRSGHMPGARNVPWNALVGEDGLLKTRDQLQSVFAAGGVDLAQPIVTTCGSGVTAALLALGLARLGREDVAVYDGSWSEWGGRSDTAVVTGA
ncbi:3-mercaptopyruvate sulfurtransferase [Phenylobacterium sp. LjRoot225]|uniref:3-mercaptopyruvate sulfurtransferase n=1 Tax=Phenylobacterium sp. LjRoot225 TaxID=3342285 RepID=UPI003ED09C56